MINKLILNTEFFIAKRLIFDSQNSKSSSRIILKISIAAISISVMAMIISIAVVRGFKNEITRKVTGFAGHIQITDFGHNNSYETSPIIKDSIIFETINNIPDISHYQIFATKPGIIKSNEQIQGIVLKGIGEDFHWDFFSESIIEGDTFSITNDLTNNVLISQNISDLLDLNVGDRFLTYFIQDPPRRKIFNVKGIYETGLESFDELFILCDHKHIQNLNSWDSSQIGGIELFVSNINEISRPLNQLHKEIGNYFYADGSKLQIFSMFNKYPYIFDWLGLMDINALVIIILVLVVASINMISGLLILVIERTNFIGILKAMGADNPLIRKIFLYHASYLIGIGLIIGNFIGLTFCYMQNTYRFLKLDQTSYYLSFVPTSIEWWHILLIDLGTLITIMIFLRIPSIAISKTSPVKAIQFN